MGGKHVMLCVCVCGQLISGVGSVKDLQPGKIIVGKHVMLCVCGQPFLWGWQCEGPPARQNNCRETCDALCVWAAFPVGLAV